MLNRSHLALLVFILCINIMACDSDANGWKRVRKKVRKRRKILKLETAANVTTEASFPKHQLNNNLNLNHLSSTLKDDDPAKLVKLPISQERKQARLFSLFSIVSFNNAGCTSQTTASSGNTAFRNGTCYTSSECASFGGLASGTCASGFGVCCVFIITTADATVSRNCSYIQNPGFPSSLTTTTGLQYTIAKCDSSVCFLRLDFETFTLLGPADTVETNGGACQDTFVVTVPTSQQIPTICGQNTGQHIYVDVGASGSDSATVAFSFLGTNNIRQWDIKVTQIPCASSAAPPNGCLQYTVGLTGRLTSFNFLDASGSSHLANQRYSQCIRQELGFCCVQYQACTDANSFSIDSTIAAAGISQVDSLCSLDFITIPASSSQCMPGTGVTFRESYCGNFFNPFSGTAANSFTCDCTPPFEVGFRTDALADTSSAIAGNSNRGVCLTYMQLPCN